MYPIPATLMEKIVNYLAKRPWLEVREMMDELLKIQPVQEEPCQPSTVEPR